MDPALRDLLPHSNWVWVLGSALFLIAAVWAIGLALAYWKSRVKPKFQVHSLSQVQRARYSRLIGEVVQEYKSGTVDARAAHLSLAAIIRAAATERTRINLEATTAAEASAMVPQWPILGEALTWCADSSFPTDVADRDVERGVSYARQVATE